MDSVILYPHPVMQCRTYPTHSKHLLRLRTGKSFLIIRDITPNCPSAFLSRRDGVQFASSFMKTNEEDKDDSNAPPISRKEKDKLARQEEIISLFRRIQSSISKGEKTGNDDDSLEDDQEKPAAESVLEIIRQSRKKANQAKSKKTKSNTIRKIPIPTSKKDKEVKIQDLLPIHRLPSNFVKRSPIPIPSAPRGKANEPGEGNMFGLQKLERMKLAELQQLAKSRGLKGYSKIKKMELVQLLIYHNRRSPNITLD